MTLFASSCRSPEFTKPFNGENIQKLVSSQNIRVKLWWLVYKCTCFFPCFFNVFFKLPSSDLIIYQSSEPILFLVKIGWQDLHPSILRKETLWASKTKKEKKKNNTNRLSRLVDHFYWIWFSSKIMTLYHTKINLVNIYLETIILVGRATLRNSG